MTSLPSALCYIGWNDRKESALVLSQQQEQALMHRLLQGRDDHLLTILYARKPVRDVYDPPTRGQSGKNIVLPFFDR